MPGIITPSIVSKLAADFGPGQTGDDTDLIFAFRFAMAVARNAEIVVEVGRGDLDRLGLALDDFGHSLAGELHQLAFKTTNTGFAGVGLDDASSASSVIENSFGCSA